jgi:putative nucleotidyltransferase with HDIG domain
MKRSILKHLFHHLYRRRKGKFTAGGTTAEVRRKRLRRILGTAHPQTREETRDPARIGLFLGTVILLSILLCIHLWPNRVSLTLGEIADHEIIAQRTVSFTDSEATRQLRDDAAQHVEKQYDPIPEATTQSLDALRTIFDSIDRVAREAQSAPAPTHGKANVDPQPIEDMARTAEAQIRRQASIFVPIPAVEAILSADNSSREQARSIAMKSVERTMNHAITDDSDDLPMVRRAVKGDPLLNDLAASLRDPVASLAAAVLMPNQRFDPRETGHKRNIAEASVAPQMVRLHAGTTVIRPGDRVTQQHLDEFAALGLQTARTDPLTVAVIVMLVLLIVSIAGVYLRLFHPELYQDTSRLLLLCTLTVISVVGLKIGSTLLGIPIREVQLGYLGMMSVASAGMVIALLLSPRAALLIVALLSVASGLILNNELRFTVVTMASSLVGIVCVSSLRNRGDLLRAGLYLCAANALFVVLVGRLEGDLPTELISGMIWGVLSGGLAVLFFIVGVAVFEKPFGITTHLRLLELSDPATPILQEFRMRVPGTYAHSLMVGSLAHAAAEAIGADGLLVRVAAYYHDLGKMNRPEFFIENQSNAENVHDRLSPSMSALILGSHVKEGLEIVSALGIPPRVRELIQQHHGTSLMKYFYHRATGGAEHPDTSLEAQFRYPGPKPQSKEAAILMLADSVEAASRVLDRPTPARISDFVQRMIDDKRADGQLDECDLTQRDLKAIHDVLVRTLSGTLHARIEYPDDRRPVVETLAAPALASFPAEPVFAALTADATTVDEALSFLSQAPEESKKDGDGSADQTRPDGAGLAIVRGSGSGSSRPVR